MPKENRYTSLCSQAKHDPKAADFLRRLHATLDHFNIKSNREIIGQAVLTIYDQEGRANDVRVITLMEMVKYMKELP